ncbi:type II restriction endonuclease [Geminocystis herdmanii]|uniref:type II restriction endonuclease n=1 Tax=Geminocystis herdmanii TaxID=669359 RepID=UPI00034B8AD7|nr:type II restriction endonuclease [Geminocystis herdmanii]
MKKQNKLTPKDKFFQGIRNLADTLNEYTMTENDQWTIKGFIDAFQNIYTISSDTKIISKILEIHLFPKILAFAQENNYKIVLAEHQNYYPDISFIANQDSSIKFALDFKTTYRNLDKNWLCNGFTLGSHGQYFQERNSTKNIQFPYSSYSGHFCLGIIYDRVENATIDETKIYNINELKLINSVISNLQFFVAEKWRIASDKRGSGNTANIGSIQRIEDILQGNGMFSRLGEEWFDDYWMNFGKITIKDSQGETKKITNLEDFVKYRQGDTSLIVKRDNKKL